MIKPIAKWDNLEHRWNTFKICCESEMEFPDDGLPSACLGKFCKDYNLNFEDSLFIAYFYGMCYNPLTTMYIWSEFKNSKLDEHWWNQNKPILLFEHDKRWIPWNDQFIPSYESFKINLDTIKLTIQQKDFKILENNCSNIKFFGVHAMFLMCDVLNATYGWLNCFPKQINWYKRKQPTRAMLMLTGFEEFNPYKENKPLSEDAIESILKLEQYIYSNIRIHPLELESVLCAFEKIYKGTRYSGYYRDRHLEDINKCKLPKWIIDFNLNARKALLPKNLLGEYSGWNGIRKEKCKEFIKNGSF